MKIMSEQFCEKRILGESKTGGTFKCEAPTNTVEV